MATLLAEPPTAELTSSPQPPRGLFPAIGGATFLGAFLLFQLQPLIGKAILPWFGGAPAVWTTAMLVFQTLLVAGYAFVHLTTRRLTPAPRSYLLLTLAAASLAALPILPSDAWRPTTDGDPALRIILLLSACIGAPYFLLSTTGPLTQEWFQRAGRGRSPYRLYALSNLGSLLGLIAYPFLLEPFFDLPTQARIWTGLYGTYLCMIGYCAWTTRRVADLPDLADVSTGSRDRTAVAPPSARFAGPITWTALAAAGSIMLLATTNHLCQDVAAVPLLWIAPLTVYLTTFIVAFDRPQYYRRWIYAVATLVFTPAALWKDLPFTAQAAFTLLMLTAVCMLAHGELAAAKPRQSRLLTTFFLCLSVGGAMGGLFVGILAPLIFDRYWEWIGATLIAFGLACFAIFCEFRSAGRLKSIASQLAFTLPAIAGAACVAQLHLQRFVKYEVDADRSFYGVVFIDAAVDKDTEKPQWTLMRSGTTRHGTQLHQSGYSRWPTAYFSLHSGIGLAMTEGRSEGVSRKVGVVGLGAGTLATYGLPGDLIRFYEINPAVVRFADEYFTFLRESFARCEVVLGDARTSLEREPSQEFDLLVLDAFSGDAIPNHLLTAEAMEIYLRHLKPDGILAMHVSNKHLDLTRVVAAAAERFGLAGVTGINAPDSKSFVESARWVLLTRNAESHWWRSIVRPGLFPLEQTEKTRLWTDSYSNLLQILK